MDIYVHAKAALVDDAWATIGSTNVANRSFHADTELNVTFWDAGTARVLRCALLEEHLGVDTAPLDDRAALAVFRDVAGSNRDRRYAARASRTSPSPSLPPATRAGWSFGARSH